MDAATNDGGPAFPVAEDHKIAADLPWTCGMTLRDYFAAKAMQGFMTQAAWPDSSFDAEAAAAYRVADAMIRAREAKS